MKLHDILIWNKFGYLLRSFLPDELILIILEFAYPCPKILNIKPSTTQNDFSKLNADLVYDELHVNSQMFRTIFTSQERIRPKNKRMGQSNTRVQRFCNLMTVENYFKLDDELNVAIKFETTQ